MASGLSFYKRTRVLWERVVEELVVPISVSFLWVAGSSSSTRVLVNGENRLATLL